MGDDSKKLKSKHKKKPSNDGLHSVKEEIKKETIEDCVNIEVTKKNSFSQMGEDGTKRKKLKNKTEPFDDELHSPKEEIKKEDCVNIDVAKKNFPKRTHSESESDHENVPKKKKKKKKPDHSVGKTDNKNKKSIRQAKREKFVQRQAESRAAAKEHIKSECINYLSQWKHNRQNWKFMKAKQVWLYKNKFSEQLVPNDSWSLLLEYFESAKGNIRNMLLTDAYEIIKQMDDWTETQNNQEPDEPVKNEEADEESHEGISKKPSETIYKRAREIIQFLQE